MVEKKGDPNCRHKWVYKNKVILTNPPIYHKICKKCGRVEEERGKKTVVRSEFSDIYEKFHGGENENKH